MAEQYGPPAPGADQGSLLGIGTESLAGFGLSMQIGGMLTSAVSGYYSAVANRYALKSQALDLEFAKTMAAINARAAESDAQLEQQAGQDEAGRVGLQYAQIAAAEEVRQAAGGIQAGVGSAAEVSASIKIAKELDMIAINANATRAANEARARGVDYRNRARLAGASATTARSSAGLISPWASGGSSLLAGAGSVAREWVANERSSARYRSGGS